MNSFVSIDLLKPHPKNKEYFSSPDAGEYEAVKQSIATHGIRDPIKILPDYTVVAGHVRLAIARELGIERVPVQVWDVSGEDAEYLLVADNEERRVCRDPVKKAKRAKFLKEYWGIRRGGNRRSKPQNAGLKNLNDVAETLGESSDSLQRLLKLNDLIPPLQELVSGGQLGQTAAYSLAFLPPEEQETLLTTLGETGVCGLSTKEAQDLRREFDSLRREKEALETRLAEAEKKLAGAGREVVYKTDPVLEMEIEETRKNAAEILKEKERLENQLVTILREKEKREIEARSAVDEAANLRRMLDHARAELKKEKERPKPPQWSPEHIEFQNLIQEATREAAGLATALSHVLERHRERLVAAARVRGTSSESLRDMAEVLGDSLLFNAFDSSMNVVLSKIAEIQGVLEPGRPKMHVIRSEEKRGGNAGDTSKPAKTKA